MRIAVYILLMMAAAAGSAFADATYPFSIVEAERHEGGRLLSNESGDLSYFVKNDFARGGVGVYSWPGIKRSRARGNTFENAECLNSFLVGNDLVVILRESEKVFALLLDSTLSTKAICEIHIDIKSYELIDATICSRRGNKILMLMNDILFELHIGLETIECTTEAENCAAAAFVEGGGYDFAYLHKGANFYTMRFIDSLGMERIRGRINRAEDISLQTMGDRMIAISSTTGHGNSLAHLFLSDRGDVVSGWIESGPKTIDICGDQKIVYLRRGAEGYEFVGLGDISSPETAPDALTELPPEYVMPIALNCTQDGSVGLFANAIVYFSEDGVVLSSDYYGVGEYFDSRPRLIRSEDYLIMSSPNMSIVFELKKNDLWWLNRFVSDVGKYLIPALLLVLLILFVQLFRHQKRLLRTVLELPSMGVIYVVDHYGRLTIANDEGRKMLGINYDVSLNKQFTYYFVDENTAVIKDLIEKAMEERESVNRKIILRKAGSEKEFLCNLQIIRNIAGNFRGVIFTGADITEQLERKRLSNWARLAHDMQTNLSTIKLNAELLRLDDEENQSRKDRIVHQTGILIQRVRDIVTVGRSDTISPQKVNAGNICREVRSEFDPAMFPDVEFGLETESFVLSCDREKMIRAIRNAVENGIRSLKDKSGRITISCSKDGRRACFSVVDTGSGMDEKTRRKFLTPYFTTSQTKGGTGIGTMIMQHVVDLHGGELYINTRKNEGTEIKFCIPLVYRK
jgi:PAS domain S-box-containing protein